MELTLGQLAALVDGTIRNGSPDLVLHGFATLREAMEGDVSFFGNDRYLPDLRTTRASAILVPEGCSEAPEASAQVVVPNPSAAFAAVVKRFVPPPRTFVPGIHPAAVVHPEAKLNPEAVCIGPCAVIEAGAEIGDGTEVGPLCFIGEGAKIGRDCLLHPRSHVAHRCILGDRVFLHAGVVVGGDGFGYEFVEGRHRKIDQVGIVQIDNDVEIGANTTIDRARFGRTWIGEGTKIDNQVMIGHNCVIGRHVIIVAQVGIAGSTRVGDYVIIAAQAGIAGHLEIGEKVVVAARAGVTKSLADPGQYMGFPATPASDMRRQLVMLRKLPELLDRISRLEERAAGKSPEAAQ